MNENLELREWIAVNVMGYAVERFNGTLVRVEPVDEIDFTVPPYELTWDDAALVVEAMRARGWNFTLDAIRVSESCVTKNVWDAEFAFGMETIDDLGPPIGCDTAPTAPLAICLAAKSAIEGTR